MAGERDAANSGWPNVGPFASGIEQKDERLRVLARLDLALAIRRLDALGALERLRYVTWDVLKLRSRVHSHIVGV